MHFPLDGWPDDRSRQAGAPPELRLDGSAKTVGAEGVLSLQVEAYGDQVILGNRLASQLPGTLPVVLTGRDQAPGNSHAA